MGTQFQATVSLYQLGLAQKAILGLFFMDELLDGCGPEKPVIFLQIDLCSSIATWKRTFWTTSVFIVILICISLMDTDIEHLFMCLLVN